ncbi:hypothetical protein N431DRAFT_168066 [Stipitochalara longipes BDJ]|nr:hypothetical protein N431DRAFT_168066 [Stipitochalara longipes BDJ]
MWESFSNHLQAVNLKASQNLGVNRGRLTGHFGCGAEMYPASVRMQWIGGQVLVQDCNRYPSQGISLFCGHPKTYSSRSSQRWPSGSMSKASVPCTTPSWAKSATKMTFRTRLCQFEDTTTTCCFAHYHFEGPGSKTIYLRPALLALEIYATALEMRLLSRRCII